ncbi:protein Jumonji-like isoform X2 [Pecten maximus]|uniref:protein Jumonji-like isoform X2 n=1 Tax=Pecten maximus TaxID=6579 RepID=UPI001458D5B1|nr:protein Jumonji-like isoform X2 [Pecten maximus]
MVGKKPPTPAGCSLKKSPGEPALAQRLRRNISPKNLDLTAGLSWREERELNKALYASLQETKKLAIKSEIESDAPSLLTNSIPRRNLLARVLPRRQSPRSSRPAATSKSSLSMRSPSLPPPADKKLKSHHNIGGGDESSQDSVRSSTTSCSNEDSKGTKVRAQRKFAQMHAYGNTMVPSQHTPVKQSSKTSSPIKVFPKRAKTEDFLTFLCLRGTQALPPHLDFFNFSRDEGDTSLPPTPPNRGRAFVRESSPSSSSTSCSNVPDDVADSPAPLVMPPSGRVTPSRKAARACAGTPETARGLASFPSRQGQRSQAASKRRYTSPAVTPAKCTRSYRTGTPSPGKGTRGKASPGKMTDAERLKKKAIATLTSSKHSPDQKTRRKSLFIDQSAMDEKPGSQRQTKVTGVSDTSSVVTGTNSCWEEARDSEGKKAKIQKERNRRTTKSTSVKLSQKSSQGRQLYTSNIVKKKKKFKPATKFIAHRLPQRKAKLRWNSCYLEEDEFDHEVSFVFKQSPDSYTNRKRKTDFDTEPVSSGSAINVPLKKTRLQKVEKKSQKAKSHGKIKLRQVKKKVKTENLKVLGQKNTQVECDSSSGVHTRSGVVLRADGGGEESAVLPSVINTDTTATGTSNKVVLEASKKRSQAKLKNTKDVMKEKLDKKKKFELLSSNEKRKKIKVKGEKISKTEAMVSDSVKQGSKNSDQKMKRKLSVKRKSKDVPSMDREVKQEPFPGPGEPARLVEAPTFYPSEEQFSDPIQYIQSVAMIAEPYGMCRIIPPSSWKPDSKISEELRFTTQKQYIHKLYDRFGPNVCQMNAIQKHLDSHGVSEPFPVIGGVEVDICKFSAVIQHLGGMQNVIEKKKLLKVADIIGIPKSAQDRGTKLYDTYCKFLVSYDMLSADKKRKLEDEVTEIRKNRKEKNEEECVLKGKNMSLTMFHRAARNIGAAWLRDPASNSTENVEKEYWNIVKGRKSHVVVHGGHIDTQTHNCTAFSSKKDNHYYSHPWNLNNLPHCPDSLLRYLGHLSGVTVPTLHMGMAFTTSCWSTDIHRLPYIQYLHTEADTVWYAVPGHKEEAFKAAMTTLVPTLVSDDPHWLREDTVMVDPDDLTENGVAVSRCVQQPGQFIVVFPSCYTSTISCGYTLAESVHYATPSWLEAGQSATKMLNDSFEPEMFSMDELLTRIAEDPATPEDVLASVLPWLQKVIERELDNRQQLFEAGLKSSKRMCTTGNLPSRGACQVEEIITTCDVSKKICYLSLVLNEVDDLAFSLEHGLAHVQKKRNIRSCKLMYRHTEEELKKLLRDVKERLNTQSGSSGVSESSDGSSPRRKQPRKVEHKS